MPIVLNLVGSRYQRLTVLARAGTRHQCALWECMCDCGNVTFVTTNNLRKPSGTKSCGCALIDHLIRTNRTHGMSGTPTHVSWRKMLERCNDAKNNEFARYGGRGIAVCERWLTFENFFADMGERPQGKTVDRKDNNQGYTPENCVWSDSFEQQRNTRKAVIVEFHGAEARLVDLCAHSGLPYSTVYQRWSRGVRGAALVASKKTWKNTNVLDII